MMILVLLVAIWVFTIVHCILWLYDARMHWWPHRWQQQLGVMLKLTIMISLPIILTVVYNNFM